MCIIVQISKLMQRINYVFFYVSCVCLGSCTKWYNFYLVWVEDRENRVVVRNHCEGCFPVSTQRCFNVHLTSITFKWRWIDVKTTSCVSRVVVITKIHTLLSCGPVKFRLRLSAVLILSTLLLKLYLLFFITRGLAFFQKLKTQKSMLLTFSDL